MKYIVYLTINTKNNKIYVGKHQVEDPDVFEGYIGCGINIYKPYTYKRPSTPFQYAVKKYGVKCFKRVTLAVFDTAKEAYELEAKIVTKEFLKRRDVYNASKGGNRGPENSIEIHQYSLTGEYIKTWESAQKAAEYFNTNNNVIRRAVNYNVTSYGYLWSEQYCDKLDLTKFTVTPQPEPVYQFDKNNNLIAEYKSVSEAARVANSDHTCISYAIRGKTTSKGYYYSYNKDFKIDQSVFNKITNVYLYNLDGTFFKEFSSPKECVQYFGENHTSAVYRSIRCSGIYKGYQISKEKVDSMKCIEKNLAPKKVAQYDLNGNLIKVWDSVMEARKTYGDNVQKCLKGQYRQTKGFVFKYYNEEVKDIV